MMMMMTVSLLTNCNFYAATRPDVLKMSLNLPNQPYFH